MAHQDDRYYRELAAAFVRGRLGRADLGDEELIALGLRQGLRLQNFKRGELPRVTKVLGILKGLAPTEILDVGSGRGAFLWPLLDTFPELAVVSIDLSLRQLRDVASVRLGGIERLRPCRQSVVALGFAAGAFHTVTVLEVLEHLESPEPAVRELLRVARRYVVASVPSKPDDNPQHLRFYDSRSLRRLFEDAGARDVRMSHVLNHRIALVKV